MPDHHNQQTITPSSEPPDEPIPDYREQLRKGLARSRMIGSIPVLAAIITGIFCVWLLQVFEIPGCNEYITPYKRGHAIAMATTFSMIALVAVSLIMKHLPAMHVGLGGCVCPFCKKRLTPLLMKGVMGHRLCIFCGRQLFPESARLSAANPYITVDSIQNGSRIYYRKLKCLSLHLFLVLAAAVTFIYPIAGYLSRVYRVWSSWMFIGGSGIILTAGLVVFMFAKHEYLHRYITNCPHCDTPVLCDGIGGELETETGICSICGNRILRIEKPEC